MSSQTDARGLFRLGGFEPGEHALSVSGSLGGCLAPPPANVKAGATDVVVTLLRGLVIAGQVLGPDDRPVTACGVSATWQGTGTTQVQTQVGPDGRFRLSPLPDVGAVTVHVTPWGGTGTADQPRSTQVPDVRPGTEDLVVRLASGVTIEGRLVTPTGEGIANASVQASAAAAPGGPTPTSHGWAPRRSTRPPAACASRPCARSRSRGGSTAPATSRGSR
jgi:hypothetical protein